VVVREEQQKAGYDADDDRRQPGDPGQRHAAIVANVVDALPADLALRYLRELSADQLGGVVLGPGGELLAGEETLAQPARDLLEAAGARGVIAVRTRSGAAFAARDDAHAIVVACTVHALDGLVAHDLQVALSDLRGARRAPEGDAGRAADDARQPKTLVAAAERLILAAQRGSGG
jgi:hypothetical protein